MKLPPGSTSMADAPGLSWWPTKSSLATDDEMAMY